MTLEEHTLEELGAAAAVNGKRQDASKINAILAELRRRDEAVKSAIASLESARKWNDKDVHIDVSAEVESALSALSAFQEPVTR